MRGTCSSVMSWPSRSTSAAQNPWRHPFRRSQAFVNGKSWKTAESAKHFWFTMTVFGGSWGHRTAIL